MRISENFFLNEFLESQTARRMNIQEQFNPPDKVIDNIILLTNTVLQPFRYFIKTTIVITSGYRCIRLNNLIGGSVNSSHIQGLAVDIYSPSMKNGEFFDRLRKFLNDNKIDYDQLIWEYGTVNDPAWIHISIPKKNEKGRKQVFSIGVNKAL